MDNIVAVPTIEVQVTSEPKTGGVIEHGPLTGHQKEAPLSIFAQENKMPYTAKFFGIGNYVDLKESNTDLISLTPKMEAIENYVIDKIINEQYLDSTKSYREIVEGLKDTLGIKHDSTHTQIDKIYAYIKASTKVEDIKKPRVPRLSRADQIEQDKANRGVNREKRIDNLIGKRLDHFYKRMDNQLKQLGRRHA